MKMVITTYFIFSFLNGVKGMNTIKDGKAASLEEEDSISTLHINAQGRVGDTKRLIRTVKDIPLSGPEIAYQRCQANTTSQHDTLRQAHATSQVQSLMSQESLMEKFLYWTPPHDNGWYPGRDAVGGHNGLPTFIVAQCFDTPGLIGNFYLAEQNDMPSGTNLPADPAAKPYVSDTHFLYKDPTGIWKFVEKAKIAQVLGPGPQDANAWTREECDVSRQTCDKWNEQSGAEAIETQGTTFPT